MYSAAAPPPIPSLAEEIARAGAIETSIIISKPLCVEENLIVPANIGLTIDQGGEIDIAAGKTLVLSGPFQASATRVFTGPGSVRFAPASTRRACPEWWGGAGEGDYSQAIQNAIDSLAEGEVVLSERTYLLSRRVTMKIIDSGDKVGAMIVPKSRIDIIGQGYASVLRVVDNHTEAGDYVIFGPSQAGTTSDIRFSNFRIDGNGSHNLVKGRIRRAMAIWLYQGKNITIDKVWFENQPGTNVVKFGGDNPAYLVSDSVIANCVFSNVGAAIPGNRSQRDHSTLYISGRNVTVRDNHLSNLEPYDENGPPLAVVAGIEIHGDDMVVSGNHVENFSNGGYIVGDGIVTAKNHRWTGNNFVNMAKLGISIWSISEVKNVLFEGNRISLNSDLDQGVAGIFQPLTPPDTTVGIDGLTLRANVIASTATRSGTVWCGILLAAASNVIIEGNTIDRMSGAGIVVLGNTQKPLDCRNILIRNNHIRDTSFSRIDAYPFAIDITNDGLGRFEDIHLAGNTIENTIAPAENMGGIRVRGKGPIDRIVIRDDHNFVNLRRRDLHLSYPGLEPGVKIEHLR